MKFPTRETEQLKQCRAERETNEENLFCVLEPSIEYMNGNIEGKM